MLSTVQTAVPFAVVIWVPSCASPLVAKSAGTELPFVPAVVHRNITRWVVFRV
jgi:hypothetical protein